MNTCSTKRRTFTIGAAAVAAAMLASCANSTAASKDASGGTFVFASSRLPTVLDGAYVYDNESQRVIYQIFERLVNVKPGPTERPVGRLSVPWRPGTGCRSGSRRP